MFWYDVMYNVFEKLKFSCLRNFPTPTAAGPRAAAAAALSLFVRCSTSNQCSHCTSSERVRVRQLNSATAPRRPLPGLREEEQEWGEVPQLQPIRHRTRGSSKSKWHQVFIRASYGCLTCVKVTTDRAHRCHPCIYLDSACHVTQQSANRCFC